MEKLLTPKEVANITGFKEETLRKWRYLGKGGPDWIPVGRNIRYKSSAVQEWIDNRPVCSSTTQARVLTQLNNAS